MKNEGDAKGIGGSLKIVNCDELDVSDADAGLTARVPRVYSKFRALMDPRDPGSNMCNINPTHKLF